MRRHRARIESLIVRPSGEPAVRLVCPPAAIPRPGQAVLARTPDSQAPLRSMLFPIELAPDGFTADLAPPPGWAPGWRVDLDGPIGNGFRPPPRSARWLLASVGSGPDRLLPLISLGLARGASIAIWCEEPIPGLPPPVEVALDLAESLRWADYLAMVAVPDSLPLLRERMSAPAPANAPRGFPEDLLPNSAEVLLAPRMPCGLGVCGACAVETRRGWKSACLDGPVLDLRNLSW